MGLIKAISGSVGSTLGDQWKEYIYCESLDNDVLVAKGMNRNSGRSSNSSGSSNVITNGSTVIVNDGQCMIIVDQGKVVEICAEPGEFTYDQSSEPSIFGGDLRNDLKAVFNTLGKRFTYGGEAPKDQRVYYFNTKKIIGNKYGTPQEIPFEVNDPRLGICRPVNLRCFGQYVYRITNPILFYTNICGNVADVYERSELNEQLKTELLDSLQGAFGILAEQGVRYGTLTSKNKEITAALQQELTKWHDDYGIELVNCAISSVKANEEDEKALKRMYDSYTIGGGNMGMGYALRGETDAKEIAAANPAGAGAAMMGVGMMGGMMGGGASAAYMNMQAQQQMLAHQQMMNQQQFGAPQGGMAAAPQQAPQQAAPQDAGWACSCGQGGNKGKFCANCGSPKPEPKPAGWTCSCGKEGNKGKFCAECGAPKPVEDPGWTCSCGAVNKGKFCPNCGGKKPADAPVYRCDKCGWEPADPKNPPKFCPECGDLFDENDQI